jgi:hypothetical protein
MALIFQSVRMGRSFHLVNLSFARLADCYPTEIVTARTAQ